MGIAATMRKGTVKKMKQTRVFSAQKGGSPKKRKTRDADAGTSSSTRKFKSTNILTGVVERRVDEGTKECKKCLRYKNSGVRDKKGHDPTCPLSLS